MNQYTADHIQIKGSSISIQQTIYLLKVHQSVYNRPYTD